MTSTTGVTSPADDRIEAAGLTYHQAVALVAAHLHHLVAAEDLAASTVQKMVAQMGSLAICMTSALGQPLVAATTSSDLARWIELPLGGKRHKGREAAATTRRLRRSAARLFFRVLRHLGLYVGDPTLDIAIPGASSTETVPLTDDELLQLRYSCIVQTEDTILPSVLALCEATATTGELPRVRICDVDLQRRVVHLRGTATRLARTNPLSTWGVRQLGRRIDALRAMGASESAPLIYDRVSSSDPGSPGAAAARAVNRLLTLAGLAGQPGIRPRSIAAWSGLRVWKDTRDIGLVAVALGCRSLDAAAAAINVDVRAQVVDAEARLRSSQLSDEQRLYQRGKKARKKGKKASPAVQRRVPAGAAHEAIAPASDNPHRSLPWQAGK